jgi:hypothetical protein
MSYKLYTDKLNKFTCNIELEGASLTNSKVRLVVESDDMTYMFNGELYNTGVCDVKIPKTKSFLPEGKTGKMYLEVIADDVYFEPWSSNFVVEQEKKVSVVVNEQIESKPKLNVIVNEQIETKPKKITETVKPVKKQDDTTLSKSEFMMRLMNNRK